MKLSKCCNASVTIAKADEGTCYYVCGLCYLPTDLKEEDKCDCINCRLEETKNTGIKTTNLSRRVKLSKNQFSITADIAENGSMTIYNNDSNSYKLAGKNDEYTFKFIGSKKGTVKAVAELLLELSK